MFIIFWITLDHESEVRGGKPSNRSLSPRLIRLWRRQASPRCARNCRLQISDFKFEICNPEGLVCGFQLAPSDLFGGDHFSKKFRVLEL
jgi:hypothetical protein